MKIDEVEIIKTQATMLDVEIGIMNYDVNRFAVAISGHSYTNLHGALTALTTAYLRADRKARRKSKRRK